VIIAKKNRGSINQRLTNPTSIIIPTLVALNCKLNKCKCILQFGVVKLMQIILTASTSKKVCGSNSSMQPISLEKRFRIRPVIHRELE